MKTYLFWLIVGHLLLGSAGQAAAQESAPSTDEPIGTWRFHHPDRPVKVVVIGGSISAWGRGNFTDFLGAVCHNAEFKNLGKTGYGAYALRRRFNRKVIKNWNVKLKDPRFDYWMLYGGGLNSIYTPEMTIKHTMETFKLAHRHGVRVVALTLTPWGDETDKRWKDFGGLDYHQKTQKAVDFVMGRLARNVALGRYADPKARDLEEWSAGELPDISVDLYDSDLRAKTALLRPLARLERLWDHKRAIQRQFPDRASAVQAAAEVPRWYLRRDLRAFDHIHPRSAGHKLIAQHACVKLPTDWGCECPKLADLKWEKGHIQ